MPRWVRLERQGVLVGAIFVLMDNILLLTAADEQELHDAWVARIEQNVRILDIKVKEGHETQRRVVLSGQNTTDFAGIRFGSRGWRTTRSPVPWAEPTTRRQASSVAGEALWELRVGQSPLFEHEAFYALLVRIASVNTTGTDVDVSCHRHDQVNTQSHWDAPFLLTAAERQAVQEILALRQAEPHAPVVPRPAEVVEYAATDATTRSVAAVEFESGPAGSGQLLPRPDVVVEALDEETDMAVAELTAIVSLARRLAARHPGKQVELRLATDSQIAHLVLRKQHARSAALLALLCELSKLPVRVVSVWLPSEENAADCPSRGKSELCPHRVAATVRRLVEMHM